MAAMSVGYQQLLDAAIRHLEELKAQGVKFVSLSPETLAALGPSPAQPAAAEPTVPGGPSSPPPQTKPASQSPVVQPQSNLAVSPVSPLASTQNPDPAKLEKRPGSDRKSTRLNSSHSQISYAVFCLKKKRTPSRLTTPDL